MKKFVSLLLAFLILLLPTYVFSDAYSKPWKMMTDCSSITTEGQGCYNTSTHVFCIGNGTSCSVFQASVSGKVCKTITNPSAADTKLWFDIASTRTVTKLWGICTGGTSVEATLKNGGADGTGSTTIAALTGAQIVDTNGASQTTISSASLTDGDMIFLTIGTVTGVVTQVMVCYE